MKKWKLVAPLCPTLSDPMDCSWPYRFSVLPYGILQVRVLECVVICFSRGSSLPRDWTQVSCIPGRFFTNWVTMEALLYSYIRTFGSVLQFTGGLLYFYTFFPCFILDTLAISPDSHICFTAQLIFTNSIQWIFQLRYCIFHVWNHKFGVLSFMSLLMNIVIKCFNILFF